MSHTDLRHDEKMTAQIERESSREITDEPFLDGTYPSDLLEIKYADKDWRTALLYDDPETRPIALLPQQSDPNELVGAM